MEKPWWSPHSWRELQEAKNKAEGSGIKKVVKNERAPDERAHQLEKDEWEATLRTRARRPDEALIQLCNPACKHDRTSYDVWMCADCDRFTVKWLDDRRKAARKAKKNGKSKKS